ncbi:MAG TPA: class I SAM-dependent methyltransferase [Propionicimonas sp.]|jgi:SAM-dependent methyltransferase
MPPSAFYNLGYRWFRMPWEIGPRPELVDLVTTGTLAPCRALDLGCGTGDNAIFLARHGFDVTGIDFAPAALSQARSKARAAGVHVTFVQDDLTDLRSTQGTFDLLVDYGTLDDLTPAQRDRYVENVTPLAGPNSRFLLWCFHWRPRRVDPWLGLRPLAPGEAERRFGDHFHLDLIKATKTPGRYISGTAAYLMTRNTQSYATP